MDSRAPPTVCGRTLMSRSASRTMHGRADGPIWIDKGDFMSDTDLKAQFGKISDTAKAATDKVKAAGERTRDQLEADVAAARDRIDAAADRMHGKADAVRDNASSEWQEIRDKWHAHVATVRARVHQKKDQIDEAEYAALDAIYARAGAEALKA